MQHSTSGKTQGGPALAGAIRTFVEERVAGAGTRTRYRKPLVGFASARDPAWQLIRERFIAGHLLPRDILPEARSVVAFFIPFSHGVVTENKRHFYISPEWARAYVETNTLIENICLDMEQMLASRGVRAAHQPPTHNYDPKTLSSPWSHKSAAYVCGLGGWGLHHMLITERGCAGRVGSLVIDVPTPHTPRTDDLPCSFYLDGSCTECMKLCPLGAITLKGLDKERCHRACMEADFLFRGQFGKAEVCGKCATGPCAFRAPGKTGTT